MHELDTRVKSYGRFTKGNFLGFGGVDGNFVDFSMSKV